MQIKEDLNFKAKKYSSIKYGLSIFGLAYLLLLLFGFQKSGLSVFLSQKVYRLSTNDYLAVFLYGLAAFILYYLLEFPLNIYRSYFLEHRFALSRQSLRDWLFDQLKAGAISFVIFSVLIQALYLVLRQYLYNWWLIISLFWIFFSVVLAKITPTLIIPLFFKYRDLPDRQLRGRILNLAKRMKVKILDVFEIDFSKKTLKANAAFVGLGKTKRILLADTLKDKYTHDEIEVILAHEFAHYRLKHLLKMVLISSGMTLALFYLIDKTNPYALGYFGLSSLSDVASLPLVFGYFILFGLVSEPLTNYISRNFEVHAD